LKEDCDCDTKRKLGSRWAAYDGADSLQSQGCTDSPLLDIAETVSESLAFVHIVDDDEVVSAEEGDLVDSGNGGVDDDDEVVFPEGDPVDIGKVGAMESGDDSDSDDEFEF
jgi:hypothetical protein